MDLPSPLLLAMIASHRRRHRGRSRMKKLRLINPMPNNNPQDAGGIFNIVPLQLVTIASLTPDDWEIEIQDEAVEPVTFDDTPTLVGITIKACTARRGFAIAGRYRAQ